MALASEGHLQRRYGARAVEIAEVVLIGVVIAQVDGQGVGQLIGRAQVPGGVV